MSTTRSNSLYNSEPSFPSTPQTLSPTSDRSKFLPLPQTKDENTIILSDSDSEDDIIIVEEPALKSQPLSQSKSRQSSVDTPRSTTYGSQPSPPPTSALNRNLSLTSTFNQSLALSDLPNNHALPNPSRAPFDILNYTPHRNPSNPPRFVPEEERELCLKEIEREMGRMRGREMRGREQRVLSDEKDEWGRRWECVGWNEASSKVEEKVKEKAKGKGKAREKGVKLSELTDFHSVEFFPYHQLEGLEWLEGVFATVGAGTIEIHRCPLTSGSNTSPTLLKRVETTRSTSPDNPDREEHMTCAWSVNTTTWPFTPMLAVAGRGRVIEIYFLHRNRKGELVVKLDRTITGHGGTIHQLKFHSKYPHLLMSCSEDRLIRLWDPTVPWGSDRVVKQTVDEAVLASKVEWQLKGKKGKRKGLSTTTGRAGGSLRPRVDGELLAILAGHEKAVFSCDFHSHFPLVASGGADGRIRLWQLPSTVVSSTPTWPTPPLLNKHPLAPSPRSPFVPPPILSPFFTTIHLHPGQWPCSVSFVSPSLTSPPSTVHIISSAPLTHPDAATTPRTSIKISSIDCLSVLPDSTSSQHLQKADRSRSTARLSNSATSTRSQEVVSPKARLPESQRDDSGFRVEKEIILESQICVGDAFGQLQTPPFQHPYLPSSEPFLVVPTTTHLPKTKDSSLQPSLYFFRPFLPPSRDPPRAQALFPPSRNRSLNDFHPRLQPSLVLDLPKDENEGSVRHFRSVALSPGGGEYIVGVGDRGLRGVWTEFREEGGGKKEKMKLDLG